MKDQHRVTLSRSFEAPSIWLQLTFHLQSVLPIRLGRPVLGVTQRMKAIWLVSLSCSVGFLSGQFILRFQQPALSELSPQEACS